MTHLLLGLSDETMISKQCRCVVPMRVARCVLLGVSALRCYTVATLPCSTLERLCPRHLPSALVLYYRLITSGRESP